MTLELKIGVVIYIVLIIQSCVTVTALYIKAKKTPVLYSLMAINFTITLWLAFAILENLSRGTIGFVYAVCLSLLPVMFIGPLFMIFSLFYVGMITGRKTLVLFLILLPTIICYLPVFSDTSRRLVIDQIENGRMVTKWGLLFNINLTISHLNFIVGSIIILYKSFKEKIRIKQNIILVTAIMFSALMNILTGAKIIKTPEFDLVPITFSLILVVVTLLVFRYKIIDIVPIAFNELFNYINSAVLIVDRDGNIVEYNDTFEEYFGDIIKLKRYTRIDSLLDTVSKFADEEQTILKIKENLTVKDDLVYEDTFHIKLVNDAAKQYTVSIVTLNSSKGSNMGKLLIIKDFTNYRTATLLKERSRLSGDLHDSLGNCINIISSNLEYAMKNYEGSTEIKECIEISYAKSTTAFLHLRRIVDELTPVDIENNGLLWALQSMFYKLRIKGIQIDFSHHNICDKRISSKKHGEAIYYLCQEAINNAVIHGKAESLTITLLQTSDQIKLYITDDGEGCSEVVKNKGLNNMISRVDSLGGSLVYGSPSEGGFNIKAVVPFTMSMDDSNEEVM